MSSERPRTGIGSRLLLAGLSLAITVLVVEIVGRAWLGIAVDVRDRVVFFSRDTWRVDPGGAIRYAPNREIRTAALYGDRVEYDVRFRTNDLGFIDTRDYGGALAASGREGHAIVGDSFTAGFHGGDPWVPRLAAGARRTSPGVEVYNLGIGATGIRDFRRLLRSAARELAFDRIAVIAISDDVMRPDRRPVEHEGRLYMCRVEDERSKCLASGSRLLLLEGGESDADLVRRARESGLLVGLDNPRAWLARRTFLGSRLRAIQGPRAGEVSGLENPIVQGWVLTFLTGLVRDFPDAEITILQLPMKHELRQRRLDLDLAPLAARAGLPYVSLFERCELGLSDFHEFDGHPNARGYDRILACVADALGL